jgi:hypothetical protein
MNILSGEGLETVTVAGAAAVLCVDGGLCGMLYSAAGACAVEGVGDDRVG